MNIFPIMILLMLLILYVYVSLHVRKHYYCRYPKVALKYDFVRMNVGLFLSFVASIGAAGHEILSVFLPLFLDKIAALLVFESLLLGTCIMIYSGYQIIKKSLQFLEAQSDLTEEDRYVLYKCLYQEEQLRPYVKYWIPFLLISGFIIFVFCVSKLNL